MVARLSKLQTVLVPLFFAIILVPMILSYLRMVGWPDESLAQTDEFLELLSNGDYDALESMYAFDGMSFEELSEEFGSIRGYSYNRFSSSRASLFGELTGFFMYYRIEFDTGDSHQGIFSIRIDENSDRPISGAIETFSVSADFGAKGFYVNVTAKEVSN